MLPLLKGYELVRASRLVKGFTKGLTTTSVGLIFATTAQIAGSTLRNPVAWMIFPFTLAITYLLNWNPIVSLLVASALGLVLHLWF